MMNAYHGDPQLALTTLEKIAEEIPSGVSSADVNRIITLIKDCPFEISSQLRKSIATELKEKINVFWTNQKIDEKLQRVKNLECSDDATARHPISPEEFTRSAKAESLKIMRESLKTKIKKIREENFELNKSVQHYSKLVQKQIDAVKSCDLVP